MNLRDRLLEAFRSEHGAYLLTLRAALVLPPGEAPTAAGLARAKAAARSFREAAGAADLPELKELARALEALLSELREGGALPVELGRSLAVALDAAAAAAADPTGPGRTAGVQKAMAGLGRPATAGAAAEAPRAPQTPLQQKLMAAFALESREHLEAIRTFLDLARAEPVGPGPRLDDAYRRAHSLKGAARACDLKGVETLAHALEALFARVRDGALRFDARLCASIAGGFDAIEDLLAPGAQLDAPAEVVQELEGCLPQGRATAETGMATHAPASMRARAEETDPPAAVPAPSRAEAVRGAGAAAPAPAARTAPGEVAEELVRVSPGTLDRILGTAAQLSTQCLQQEELGRDLAGMQTQLSELTEEWQRLRSLFAAQVRRAGAASELHRLARQVDTAEQTTRALAREARDLVRVQRRGGWALQMFAEQMRAEVQRARMTPVESVFQVFRKMVRDIARDNAKQVDFQVSGFQVQADRVVLQALKDPLMHMLRNAVSHGLESPAERRAAGKNETGTLRLSVRAQGNRLCLDVQDDGRGIDRQKVARTAVRQRLISAAEAERVDHAQAARLIFEPGFSTAESVTELSGRGMGLSVVQDTIHRLHGTIELPDPLGSGTHFRITVPLTISTHRILLVDLAGQTFALPANAVVRLVRAPVGELTSIGGVQRILFEGEHLPVVALGSLIGLEQAAVAAADGRVVAVILRTPHGLLAAAVDRLLAERDALIKDLDPAASRGTHFDGAVLLEGGGVALVIDPAGLSAEDARRALEVAPAPEAHPTAASAATSILVVDDSFTTRTLETSLLEAHGFEVHVAVDGLKALDQLRAHKVDLVISDVEMPNLDGLGLVQAIKRDPSLASIPVILVSSLGRPEHHARGLEVGAAAYIAKQRFDHQELLQAIAELV